MLGLLIGLVIGGASAGTPAPHPTISSTSSVLADPLGGDSITITGTHMTGVTGVTWNGVAQTITGSSDTSITITTVAPGDTGSLDLIVTTPAGSSSPYTLRSWYPGLIASCTSLFERPNYGVVSTTGTWTARVGSTSTNGGLNAPTASSGSPLTNGASQGIRLAQNMGACFTMSGTPAGSSLAIVNPTSFSSHGASYPVDPAVWAEEGRGAIGQSIAGSGSSGTVTSYATDGSYKLAQQSIVTGSDQMVMFRFQSGTDIGVRVGAAAWTNTTLGTYSPVTTHIVQLFTNYNETGDLLALMKVFATFSARISDSDSNDCYAWAQVRHGAT